MKAKAALKRPRRKTRRMFMGKPFSTADFAHYEKVERRRHLAEAALLEMIRVPQAWINTPEKMADVAVSLADQLLARLEKAEG